MPLISVLMPFYNSDRTLGEAVDSILSQTIADFELILVNDGSTDGSLAVAQERASRDPRITVIGDDRNRGLVTRLNEGLALCRGEFVARMDADDWSFPNRFAAQLEYLQRHRRVVAVSGAFLAKFGDAGRFEFHAPDCDAKHDAWRVPALEPRLPHPFMMVRAAAIAQIGGYRHVLHAEDTDLCWRLLEIGEIRNLEELLGEYSVHDESISSKSARNGRLQAVFSQLSVLAARRRLKGRADLRFSPERGRQAAASAASFAELTEFAGRAYGLNEREKRYLALGSVVKYLQHSKVRPYELESVDTQFALNALSLGLQVDADPRTYRTIRGTYRQTFKRMLHLSRYQDALQLFFASPRSALFKPLIRAPQI